MLAKRLLKSNLHYRADYGLKIELKHSKMEVNWAGGVVHSALRSRTQMFRKLMGADGSPCACNLIVAR